MVGTFISETDSAWLIYLLFLNISERLYCPKFSHEDLVYRQFLIDKFFPNSHFLQHYPKIIEKFCPYVKSFRFEAKHPYFKSCLALKKKKKKEKEKEKQVKHSVHGKTTSDVHGSILFQGEFIRT